VSFSCLWLSPGIERDLHEQAQCSLNATAPSAAVRARDEMK
jgi:hypothetical protein